jgi:hypothetical protein
VPQLAIEEKHASSQQWQSRGDTNADCAGALVLFEADAFSQLHPAASLLSRERLLDTRCFRVVVEFTFSAASQAAAEARRAGRLFDKPVVLAAPFRGLLLLVRGHVGHQIGAGHNSASFYLPQAYEGWRTIGMHK